MSFINMDLGGSGEPAKPRQQPSWPRDTSGMLEGLQDFQNGLNLVYEEGLKVRGRKRKMGLRKLTS